jgi:hypothetical protein
MEHVDDGVWTLIPVGEALLKRMSALVGAAQQEYIFGPAMLCISPQRATPVKSRFGPTTVTCWRPLRTPGWWTHGERCTVNPAIALRQE